MALILAEERVRGWNAAPVASVQLEKQLGCDTLSTPPGASDHHRIEVKGWGEPLLRIGGKFRPLDILRPKSALGGVTCYTRRRHER